MGLFGALIVRPRHGRQLRVRPGRLRSSTRTRSSCSCCPRSTRTSTPRSSRARRVQHEHLPPALLADQRPAVPRQHRGQLRDAGCPSQPYGSLATDPPVRRDHEPAARQPTATSRWGPSTTRSTPTATTARSSAATAPPLAGRRRRGHGLRQVRRQHRPRPDLGRPVQLEGRRGLLAVEPGPRQRARPAEPDASGCSTAAAPTSGVQEPMPPGVQTLNECGEFYIIAHNHALHQLTVVGRDDDRADHLHAGRSAHAQRAVRDERQGNDDATGIAPMKRTLLSSLVLPRRRCCSRRSSRPAAVAAAAGPVPAVGLPAPRHHVRDLQPVGQARHARAARRRPASPSGATRPPPAAARRPGPALIVDQGDQRHRQPRTTTCPRATSHRVQAARHCAPT